MDVRYLFVLLKVLYFLIVRGNICVVKITMVMFHVILPMHEQHTFVLFHKKRFTYKKKLLQYAVPQNGVYCTSGVMLSVTP